jgi:hypothetical protein
LPQTAKLSQELQSLKIYNRSSRLAPASDDDSLSSLYFFKQLQESLTGLCRCEEPIHSDI